MDNRILKRGILSIIFLFVVSGFVFSQTQQQTKNFINISMKGVYKVQKEILKKTLTSSDAEFKKCAKYQFIAVKLYNENKFAEAVGYSYKSRVLAVEILDPIDKMAREKMKLSDEEKLFCDPAKYTNLKITTALLNSNDAKRIDDLNSSDYAEFRKLELGIPIE